MSKQRMTKTTAVLIMLSFLLILGGIIWLIIDTLGVFHPLTFVIIGIIIFVITFIHHEVKEHLNN